MILSSAQLTSLKNNITANNNQVTYNGTPTAISALHVNGPDGGAVANLIADWYNLIASPAFYVWRTAVSRNDVYNTITASGTVWDWSTFKSQNATEQTAWIQMFMGDRAPMDQLNLRAGIFAVFSGTAAQNNQRAHIFNVGKRTATNAEKLLAAAPQSGGGITVGPNFGNTTTDPAGSITNPHVMGIGAEGILTGQNVFTAMTS